MTNRALTSLLCTAFFALSIVGQCVPTTIQGNAFFYRGKALEIRKYSDLYTFQSIVLAKEVIPDDGSFRFTIDVEDYGVYLLKIGRVNAHLFVKPGTQYTVLLSEPIEGESPLLAKDVFILPEVFESDGELNAKITALEKKVNGFIIDHSTYYRRSVSRKILPAADSLIADIESQIADERDPYFKTYARYRMASFELQTNHSRKKVFDKYFKGQEIEYSQLSYSNAFNLFFTDYFEFLNPVREQRFQANADTAVRTADYHRLYNCMAVDPFLADRNIRELVIAAQLYELGHRSDYPLENILILLDSLMMNAGHDVCKNIAANAQQELTMLAPGTLAPDFEFTDFIGNIYRLSEYEGRFVYIQFFDKFDAETLRQMSLMKVLKEGYGSDIAMFSISTQESLTRMKIFAEKYDFEWLFGLAVSPEVVTEQYDLRALPSYYYLDDSLKFIKSPAPPPGARIEKLFAKSWNARHPNKALHFKLQPPPVEEDSAQAQGTQPK